MIFSERLKVLAKNVRERRIAKGWDILQLSCESGVSDRYLQYIELGLANPSLNKLTDIAFAFGCDPTDLLK